MARSGPGARNRRLRSIRAVFALCPIPRCYSSPHKQGILWGQMQRREFITLVGGAAVAWPLAARAQQPDRMRRIGVLMAATADDPDYQARFAAFAQRLAQLGWVDGRNVRIDTRWATSKPDEIRRHAAELAALAPD